MQIRRATIDDYDAYVRLFSELGVDDPLPTRSHFGEHLTARTIVAALDGRVVGYALYEQLRDTGYIRNIVSDPALRRRGIGRALMAELCALFIAGGAARWCLNVKHDNAAAIALYESCGLRTAYRSTVLRMPREVALAPPPPSLAISTLPPADDALAEQRFALLPGQLASSRGKPDRELLQLVRDGELAGVAILAPAFPGAFPFRVSEPALGAPFLAHLRARIPADTPYLQSVAEDDDALAAQLLALGARTVLEILHLRGPLPAPTAATGA